MSQCRRKEFGLSVPGSNFQVSGASITMLRCWSPASYGHRRPACDRHKDFCKRRRPCRRAWKRRRRWDNLADSIRRRSRGGTGSCSTPSIQSHIKPRKRERARSRKSSTGGREEQKRQRWRAQAGQNQLTSVDATERWH